MYIRRQGKGSQGTRPFSLFRDSLSKFRGLLGLGIWRETGTERGRGSEIEEDRKRETDQFLLLPLNSLIHDPILFDSSC